MKQVSVVFHTRALSWIVEVCKLFYAASDLIGCFKSAVEFAVSCCCCYVGVLQV